MSRLANPGDPGTDRPLPMRNRIQPYDWGSRTVIAVLQGRPVPSPGPEAELWMGAHPLAPSEVSVDGAWVPLPELIRRDPEAVLGRRTARRFHGELPFLFKVLAAGRPLSIQVHPDARQAREGFDRENALGMAVDDPRRNYRDPRPKPEVFCATVPSRTMIGLRSREELLALPRLLPGLSPAAEALQREGEGSGPSAFLGSLLGLDRDGKRRLIGAARAWAGPAAGGTGPQAEAAGWVLKLAALHPDDIGVLAPLLLNIVRLEPGEAVFIGPGVMHAYLAGAGIELMGNSDNVLRGGLTSKNVDPPELLRVMRPDGGRPRRVAARRAADGAQEFPAPAEEFRLARVETGDGTPFEAGAGHGVEVLLTLTGRARVRPAGRGPELVLPAGASLFVPASAGPYRIEGPAVLYRASVPDGEPPER